MTDHARKWSPLVAFAVALAAALATLSGAPDPGMHAAPGREVATPVVDLLFMADRFEDQKRDAAGGELPPQF